MSFECISNQYLLEIVFERIRGVSLLELTERYSKTSNHVLSKKFLTDYFGEDFYQYFTNCEKDFAPCRFNNEGYLPFQLRSLVLENSEREYSEHEIQILQTIYSFLYYQGNIEEVRTHLKKLKSTIRCDLNEPSLVQLLKPEIFDLLQKYLLFGNLYFKENIFQRNHMIANIAKTYIRNKGDLKETSLVLGIPLTTILYALKDPYVRIIVSKDHYHFIDEKRNQQENYLTIEEDMKKMILYERRSLKEIASLYHLSIHEVYSIVTQNALLCPMEQKMMQGVLAQIDKERGEVRNKNSLKNSRIPYYYHSIKEYCMDHKMSEKEFRSLPKEKDADSIDFLAKLEQLEADAVKTNIVSNKPEYMIYGISLYALCVIFSLDYRTCIQALKSGKEMKESLHLGLIEGCMIPPKQQKKFKESIHNVEEFLYLKENIDKFHLFQALEPEMCCYLFGFQRKLKDLDTALDVYRLRYMIEEEWPKFCAEDLKNIRENEPLERLYQKITELKNRVQAKILNNLSDTQRTLLHDSKAYYALFVKQTVGEDTFWTLKRSKLQ